MKSTPSCFRPLFSAVAVLSASWLAHAAGFTPLVPAPAPRITEYSVAYPGGAHNVGNLLDGQEKTEYSSNAKGTNTFVEFDFGAPVRLGAFRHVDRNDPATVAGSELVFLDAEGKAVAAESVTHVNTRGGETLKVLGSPVTAQRVRWRITRLGSPHSTVGGAEIGFFTAGAPAAAPAKDQIEIRPQQVLRKRGEALVQPVKVILSHPYMESAEATLNLGDAPAQAVTLKPGRQVLEVELPAVDQATAWPAVLAFAGQPGVRTNLLRQPVRHLTVYVLPHSHTDIGYTEIQTDIEKKQVNNLLQGMEAARKTADYPEGARFVWNVEVLWAADLYQRRLTEAQRKEFLDAVKKGQVTLCGMYLNELTGLCRPEELLRLFRFSTKLAEQCGVTIDSAMISDVPGYTWGTVPAMNHAGIKYFSTAPNYFDRIGDILVQWENKPFYWLGPDGRSKVLVWIPFWGYAMSHRYGKMSPQLVEDFLAGLDKRQYPYDIAHVRWSGHGDNAVPDPAICDFIRDWNAQYAWPKFIIAGASEAFQALEKKYGAQLPVARGDWTPYWEDGAGSSARETAMNRASSDRLSQAETLFAMRNPKAYPAAAFEDAMNAVLLYSEHTWGAWCSVSGPDRKETLEQWEIKKGYAEQADRQTRALLQQALPTASAGAEPGATKVVNSLAWTRSGLVVLPRELAAAGQRVVDDRGKPVPSQRLASGELAFLAADIPSLASRAYRVTAGEAFVKGRASAQGNVLDNGAVRLIVDEKTGAIRELKARGITGNFADPRPGAMLNDYLYLPGDDVKKIQRNGPVTIRVGEPGPLVASLIVESAAPGCRKLVRELRVVAGQDYVECLNLVDKARLNAPSYMAKEGKESVNFGFSFNVPGGQMRLELPFGVIRPDADLLASACKNWFTVGRWADVSARDRGITWVTLDAPLVEVGGITANLLNSQYNPAVWRHEVEPSQKLYSWAMNNHWGTNYRAYQDGPVWFRFILRPHRKYDPAEATRFAAGFSQPLLAGAAPGLSSTSLLTVDNPGVIVLSAKPSDDGRAVIVRLYGASGKDARAQVKWGALQPAAVHLSDTSEKAGAPVTGPVSVPGFGVITLRAELAQ